MQLYPESTEYVPDYLVGKYEGQASSYWDKFYKRNGDKFFKDRHYFDREFPELVKEPCTILEVGCGVGNALFPISQLNPQAYIHAFDFSARAIQILKKNEGYDPQRINAFVADLSRDDLSDQTKNFNIQKESVDYIMMIFVLSALKPTVMLEAIQNLKGVLKRGSGRIFFRDYYVGDLAQVRFEDKKQKLGDNYFVRGDGTTTYFFKKEELVRLFKEAGLQCLNIEVVERQIENYKKGLTMNRQWIQAVFSADPSTSIQQPASSINNQQIQHLNSKISNISIQENHTCTNYNPNAQPMEEAAEIDSDCQEKKLNEWEQFTPSIFDADLGNSNQNQQDSEMQVDGLDFVQFEERQIQIGQFMYRIGCVDRTNQHTFCHTGLMLWEGSEVLARIIHRIGADFLHNKCVLELGSGVSPLCGLASARFCRKIILTDGNEAAIPFLKQNLRLNSHLIVSERVKFCRLIWNNEKDILKSHSLLPEYSMFDVLLGADVMYCQENVDPFFSTCRKLFFGQNQGERIVLLCHVQRGVTQDYIDNVACKYGFQNLELPPHIQNAFQKGCGLQALSYFCVKLFGLRVQ